MACIYTEHDTLPIVELRVLGRVTEHDMDGIIPKLEAFIDRHGAIRILEVIERFDGFDPSTILDGMKFDLKHLSDVTHAAVVSDIPWVSFMTSAFATVMPLTMRVFTMDQMDAARSWIEAPD
ncbi:MAG: STAS/SEC14 domain-containing protein [Silicimonas sp.]|nr:STAS/SEC14 domain-containing protein [Silicimonas sp.]NND20797.1 STAS/SEC14 domain-containing protein [Silicimonas sp.]NNL35358.1 STAS/SEC14 domain-containing protein [Silicimonas sp.]NNL73253.1 STAS/SEC14 domain-containing protein [Silicimonas sp.]RZW08395.1 MAG: STAS/SEC14 domain-containing protein [Paracoccaceae bacterium]